MNNIAFPFIPLFLEGGTLMKIRVQLTGFGYFLLPCGTQRSNSGHQPWLQE